MSPRNIRHVGLGGDPPVDPDFVMVILVTGDECTTHVMPFEVFKQNCKDAEESVLETLEPIQPNPAS